MRAQASVELMVLLAVSLLIVIGYVQLSQDSLNTYDRMVRGSQTKALLNELESSSRIVYQQGYGAKTRVYVSIPSGIKQITAVDRNLVVEFMGGSKSTISFDFDVVIEMPTDEGNYWLDVEAMKGFVIIASNSSQLSKTYSTCGNDEREPGEECDGLDLAGKGCNDFGYAFGTLQCSECLFDTSFCTNINTEICVDGLDNDEDGFIDCDDADCIGKIGPFGGFCCAGSAASCPGIFACKECGLHNECIFHDTSTLCDESYFCSDPGNNGFRSGGRIPSQGYCDGFGNCDVALSSPLCSHASTSTTESIGSDICQDGYSTCVDSCEDEVDNDQDGCIDSADVNCGGAETLCDDGIDNNCNGAIDCDDVACNSFPGCSLEDCLNGIDDDSDGKVDCADPNCVGQVGINGDVCCAGDKSYCTGHETCKECGADFECYYYGSATPCDTTYLCSEPGDDGYNIDGHVPSQGFCDGLGNCDYGHTSPYCSLEEGNTSEYSGGFLCKDGNSFCVDTCNDGIDNDNDGCIDLVDSGCGNHETNCVNGKDDDCDGRADCHDADCATHPDCADEEINCTDGIDNDYDLAIDCDDPNCIGQIGPDGMICCDGVAGNCPGQAGCRTCGINNECMYYGSSTVCNLNYMCSSAGDGGYNTGGRVASQGFCDGFGNCDFGASTPLCTVAENYPSEGSGITTCVDLSGSCSPTCTDGIDNDFDGCTDAVDSGCGGFETMCNDGIDNDCDGAPDCADIDCVGVLHCIACIDRTACGSCIADRGCKWCSLGKCLAVNDCKTGASQQCAGGQCFDTSC